MKLGRIPFSAGSKIRYEVDYSSWLVEGDTLASLGTSVVQAVTTPLVTDVIISGVQVVSDHLYFFVSGGTVSEVFTVTVTATDSRNEIAIDTIDFFVVAQ